MERVAAGDEEALGPLYDRYGRLVYSLAVHIVRDAATAEDVTQEAFVRLWRAAASFEASRGQVRAWLLRITHNLCLNELRRQRSRPVAAPVVEGAAEDALLPDTDASVDPAAMAARQDQRAAIRGALAQLPEVQRVAIELAFFGGLTQAEVAAAVGDPLGTVKSRIRVGMQRMRELLVAAGYDERMFEEHA